MTPAPRFGSWEARCAIDAICAEAERLGRAAIIAIADSHGDLVAFLRMEGAALSSIDIAINKAYTAARVGTTTRALGEASRSPTSAFDVAYYGSHRFVGWGGGLPIRFADEVIGAVAVSGVTEAEDENLALIGVALILEAMRNESSGPE